MLNNSASYQTSCVCNSMRCMSILLLEGASTLMLPF